ncbi:nitroreductase [Kaistella solincola]|uniref:Nitroreductase n=1 Tax=Kaistella solincola TaxID=510955 RepID=A0ABR4ZPP6_9FLAO|nr:nitroreductase family protein [Kaistella solincola]KIA82958.1 nitroreductase [Kaistella solincola]
MKNSEILKTLIESRKSTFPKSYAGGNIEKNVLEEIVSSAKFAPSHKRTKPGRFKVFEGEEKLELGRKMAAIYKEITPENLFLEKKYNDISLKSEQASAIVVINANFSGLVPEWEEVASVAMGVQNMYLTATAHGIACYWSTPKMINYLSDFLSLEDNQKCLGLFNLGNLAEIAE